MCIWRKMCIHAYQFIIFIRMLIGLVMVLMVGLILHKSRCNYWISGQKYCVDECFYEQIIFSTQLQPTQKALPVKFITNKKLLFHDLVKQYMDDVPLFFCQVNIYLKVSFLRSINVFCLNKKQSSRFVVLVLN